MTQIEQTRHRREDVAKTGTYDIYIEIDIDCEELVDACGLDYTRTEDDDTQNEVCISLNKQEWETGLGVDVDFACTNEQDIGEYLLNAELAEYVTKVTIYKPSGDKITFE
tara:strand:- start:133 stop:462 length:330 start_codon:yes stop_codon:yes gene_type:complete